MLSRGWVPALLTGPAGKGTRFFSSPVFFLSLSPLVRTKIASMSRQRPGGPGNSSCIIYSPGQLRRLPLKSAAQRKGSKAGAAGNWSSSTHRQASHYFLGIPSPPPLAGPASCLLRFPTLTLAPQKLCSLRGGTPFSMKHLGGWLKTCPALRPSDLRDTLPAGPRKSAPEPEFLCLNSLVLALTTELGSCLPAAPIQPPTRAMPPILPCPSLLL